MTEKRTTDSRSKKKPSHDRSARKQASSTERSRDVPLLRHGANTNFHIWKKKLTVKANQEYGMLSKLLDTV